MHILRPPIVAMPTNRAAYLTAKSARPLEVRVAPYTPPGANEIVVKTGAIAVNLLDWAKQVSGDIMYTWIKYPFVLGSDVAGTVVEVGTGDAEKIFRVGDRVVGFAAGMDKRSNKASEGAFQEYAVLRTNLSSKIPDSLTFEKACVLPMGLSTAACGLFMKDYLALKYPTTPPVSTGETLVVWGGSTSVGCNAIQLAKAAGYEVVTTASPKNFELVKSLGASQVFDYHSPEAISDIITALNGKTCAGAFAIGNGSLEACMEIVSASKGRKFVAQATVPIDMSKMQGWNVLPSFVGMVTWNISMAVKARFSRVTTKFIWGSDTIANEVGRAVFTDFLPAALASGEFRAAPEPQVVGKGLESIQEALDLNMKGVSAKKLVVTM